MSIGIRQSLGGFTKKGLDLVVRAALLLPDEDAAVEEA
jgi:hypothetical protein